MSQKSNTTLVVTVVLILAVAAVVRFFGSGLMSTLRALHGHGGGGH